MGEYPGIMKNKNLSAVLALLILFAVLISGCSPGVKETPSPQSSVGVGSGNTGDGNGVKPEDKSGETTEKPGEGQQNTPPAVEQTPKPEVPPPVKEVIAYRSGDKGDKIREIQKRLNVFNYNIKVDGSFGPQTLWAVKDFQKRNKLKVDGVVGETTLAKLALKPTSATRYTPPPAPPKQEVAGEMNSIAEVENFVNTKGLSSSTKYLMWVNTNAQHTYVFTGEKGSWKLYRDMRCTVGKPSTPTIKGTFKISDRGTSFRPDSNTVCKYWTRFKGGYLFHSVLLNNDGSIQDGRLGMRLSHGCVRLSIENAKFVYDSIPAGTTVFVN